MINASCIKQAILVQEFISPSFSARTNLPLGRLMCRRYARVARDGRNTMTTIKYF